MVYVDDGKAYYHIVVEDGKVVSVDYVSATGYWDREIEPDELFVEHRNTQSQQ